MLAKLMLICCFGLIIVVDAQQIAAGRDAELHEFPFMASIRSSKKHICGGAIVHKRWILTAAHCIFNQTENDLTVVVGSTRLNSGGFFHKVKWLMIHDMYEYVPDVIALNDIGMIYLKTPITMGPSVKPVGLTEDWFKPGLNTAQVGWGKIPRSSAKPSNTLKTISLSTISNEECSRMLPDREFNIGNLCTSIMRGEAGCYGDSGSPLIDVISGKLIGIHSWSMSPCGLTGVPDGYTNVWEFLDWIDIHITLHH